MSGSFLDEAGLYEPAEALYRKAIDVNRRLLGYHQPDTLETARNLAVLLEKQGNYEEAKLFYNDVLLSADLPGFWDEIIPRL